MFSHLDDKTSQKLIEQYVYGFEKFKKSIIDFDPVIVVFSYSVRLVIEQEYFEFKQDFLDSMKHSLGINPNGKIITNSFTFNVLDETPKKLAEIFLVSHLFNKKIEPKIIDELTEQIKLFFELCIQKIPYAKKILTKKSLEKGPLGSWAFPQSRRNDLLPLEKDTQIETQLYDELEQHFNDSISISDESSLEIQDILSKKMYPDIFKEPKVKTIYRGMTVAEIWFKTLLKSNQINDNIDYFGVLNLKFTFNPLRNKEGSTSWTTSKHIAKRFANDNYRQNYSGIKLILIASVSNNKNKLLACTNGLYKLSSTMGFDDEDEVIGLGPIAVDAVEWYT